MLLFIAEKHIMQSISFQGRGGKISLTNDVEVSKTHVSNMIGVKGLKHKHSAIDWRPVWKKKALSLFLNVAADVIDHWSAGSWFQRTGAR